MDEHRLGPEPVLRRVWAPRGSHPVAPVRPRCRWLCAWAFVRPATGETFWLLPPTVSVEARAVALRGFARAVGAGPERPLALAWDGAGWHASRRIEIPAGLHPIRLPASSPELQPAEPAEYPLEADEQQSSVRGPWADEKMKKAIKHQP